MSSPNAPLPDGIGSRPTSRIRGTCDGTSLPPAEAATALPWLFEIDRHRTQDAVSIQVHPLPVRRAPVREVQSILGVLSTTFAGSLKRPHSVVGMIESHQRQVTVPEFIMLAEALGADPLELLRQVLRERSSGK